MDTSMGDDAAVRATSSRREVLGTAGSSPMKPLALSDAPRHPQIRSASAQNVLSCSPPTAADGTSQVLKDVRGFYRVKNEDDLVQCMEGLNALFSRAVDFETDGATTTASPVKPRPQPLPARRPKTATALTPRSAQQRQYLDRAIEILNGPPTQLTHLLQTPAIQAAMNATGIVADEFQAKTREDFAKEKNRAWSVPAEVATMRFKHYEKTRKNNLALLLQVAADEAKDADDADEKGHCEYSRELAHEHKLLEAMIKGRLKYEKILEKEAVKIGKKRAQYLVVDNGVVLRRPGESEALQLRQQMNAERAEQNRLKMERVQHQRELLEETRQQNADARRRFEKSKNESSKREKDATAKDKRSREDDRQRKRQQVLNDAKATDAQRRQAIQSTLDDKEEALREKRMAMQRQSLLQKESKRLMTQEREANVVHIKNVQAYKKEQAARKIQANYRRIDNLNEVKQAIVAERNRIHKLAGIRYSHCKDLSDEIRLTPGPGEYNPPLNKRTSGGMWSPLPKGPTDVQRLHATPGPGAYDDVDTLEHAMKTTGTTFAKSRLLNSLQAQLGPGPGQYISSVKSSTFNPNKGPLFPNSNVASPFEIALRRAAELPAPCDYSPSTFPRDLAPTTVDFKRALHTMTTSYLLASKSKQDVMIDTDINALEQAPSDH